MKQTKLWWCLPIFVLLGACSEPERDNAMIQKITQTAQNQQISSTQDLGLNPETFEQVFNQQVKRSKGILDEIHGNRIAGDVNDVVTYEPTSLHTIIATVNKSSGNIQKMTVFLSTSDLGVKGGMLSAIITPTVTKVVSPKHRDADDKVSDMLQTTLKQFSDSGGKPSKLSLETGGLLYTTSISADGGLRLRIQPK